MPSPARSRGQAIDEASLNLGPHLEYLMDPTGSLDQLRDCRSMDALQRRHGELLDLPRMSIGFASLCQLLPDAPSAFLHILYPLLDEISFLSLPLASVPSRHHRLAINHSMNGLTVTDTSYLM